MVVSNLKRKVTSLQRENENLKAENECLINRAKDAEKVKRQNDLHYSESSLLAQELISLRTENDRLRSENKRKARSESLVGSKEKLMSSERAERRNFQVFHDSKQESTFKREASFNNMEEKSHIRWNESEEYYSAMGSKNSFREGSFSKGSLQYDTPERHEVRNLFGQFQKEIIPTRVGHIGGSRPQPLN